MATHSSVLAWRIPWTEEPGGLPSMGSHRVRHDWNDLAAAMMLKLKLQYFGHLMQRADSLEKTHAGRDPGQEEKGTTEDEMAGWHHWLNGCESEWTPGVGDGHGGLACCDSWGRKKSDMTEWLNWTELNVTPVFLPGESHGHRSLVGYSPRDPEELDTNE